MSLICGVHSVLEALDAGVRHFDRLLIVKGSRSRRIADVIRRAGQAGVPLRFEARETLDRMAGGLNHQGIMGVVSSLPLMRAEDLLEAACDPALLLVLDGVEDPRNMGAILRTAETAGADGVLIPERRTAALSETVSRASAGAADHVRVARVRNLAQTLEALKARGIWVIGFDASGEERWDAVEYTRPVALVLGDEGRGIRRLVRERCDHLVSIPLFGSVDSLNVSVAAGIALYEVIRQRRTVPSQVRPIPLRSDSEPEAAEMDPAGVGDAGSWMPAWRDDENDPVDGPAPAPGGKKRKRPHRRRVAPPPTRSPSGGEGKGATSQAPPRQKQGAVRKRRRRRRPPASGQAGSHGEG
jgi:23S rRNA (guanosine2251-2'-O)-methyltransferase